MNMFALVQHTMVFVRKIVLFLVCTYKMVWPGMLPVNREKSQHSLQECHTGAASPKARAF